MRVERHKSRPSLLMPESVHKREQPLLEELQRRVVIEEPQEFCLQPRLRKADPCVDEVI